MSGRVQDRVIVVTGAAGGQGAAEVAALRDEGAIVVATDVQSFAGEELERVHRCRLDVTSREDWAALAARARDQFGRVDGLINNAGIASRARLGEVVLEEWNRALAINLTGPMLGIQALSPLMGAGASIVNVGSVAGLTAHHTAAYTASKWGLRGLTRLAAMELRRHPRRRRSLERRIAKSLSDALAPSALTDALGPRDMEDT